MHFDEIFGKIENDNLSVDYLKYLPRILTNISYYSTTYTNLNARLNYLKKKKNRKIVKIHRECVTNSRLTQPLYENSTEFQDLFYKIP